MATFPDRISIHLTGQSADELVAAAREAESAGVASIFASELYGNPFVPLAAVASHTSSMKLGTGIALAFVPPTVEVGDEVAIDIRGTAVPAKVVKPPFVAPAPPISD